MDKNSKYSFDGFCEKIDRLQESGERESVIKTCCFFGHRIIFDSHIELASLVREKVEELISEGYNRFLFGGYGEFDGICFAIVRELKKQYKHIKTVYVQAYYKHDSRNEKFLIEKYDQIEYPEIGDKPPKFAIIYRNQKIIDESEFCIFYVKRSGGAERAMGYSKRNNVPFINLADNYNY